MFKSIFYTTKSGKSPVQKFLNEQDIKVKVKTAFAVKELEIYGYRLKRPKAALIEDGIYELRVEYSPNNYRVLYYFCLKKYIVLLSAFKKKKQVLKRKDIETAKARRNDFNIRMEKGEIIL